MPDNSDEMLRVFHEIDRNGDHVLTRRELEDGLQRSGVSEDKIRSVMGELDLNQDGNITLGEYKMALGLTQDSTHEWKALFKSMDKDRSGTITLNEVKAIFDEAGMQMSTDVLQDWIEEHDTNQDGQLDYSEFISFVTELASQ